MITEEGFFTKFFKHLYKSSIIQVLLYSLHFLLIPLLAPLLAIFFNVYGPNEGSTVILVSVTVVIIFSTLYFSDSTFGLIITSPIYYILVVLYHTDRTIYGVGPQSMFDFFSDELDMILLSVCVLFLEVTSSLLTKFFRFLKNEITNH